MNNACIQHLKAYTNIIHAYNKYNKLNWSEKLARTRNRALVHSIPDCFANHRGNPADICLCNFSLINDIGKVFSHFLDSLGRPMNRFYYSIVLQYKNTHLITSHLICIRYSDRH